MVKPTTSCSTSSGNNKANENENENENERRDITGGRNYKGVRKRKWGKYVSEIRLPNSRERIWLGSYDTPEKAARAFDAALFCLRGKKANFNFPNNPPEIENGRSLTPTQIQSVAAKFANDQNHHHHHEMEEEEEEEEVDDQMAGSRSVSLDSNSEVSSSGLSTSNNNLMTMDWSFLDLLSTVPDYTANFGGFNVLDDDFLTEFIVPPPPPPESDYIDHHQESNNFEVFNHHDQQQSFLWNF